MGLNLQCCEGVEEETTSRPLPDIRRDKMRVHLSHFSQGSATEFH